MSAEVLVVVVRRRLVSLDTLWISLIVTRVKIRDVGVGLGAGKIRDVGVGLGAGIGSIVG